MGKDVFCVRVTCVDSQKKFFPGKKFFERNNLK